MSAEVLCVEHGFNEGCCNFFKCNHVSKFNGEFSSGNRFALSVECALMLPIEQGALFWPLSFIIRLLLLNISRLTIRDLFRKRK